jgi:hypothetical protein
LILPVIGREVSIDVDGTQVRGGITVLEPHTLEVEITEPFTGALSRTGHVLFLARPFIRYVDTTGSITEQGIERLERLLRALHAACRQVASDLPAIVHELDRAQREVQLERERAGVLTTEQARRERVRLRQQLRRGGLEKQIYDRELGVLRARELAALGPESRVFELLAEALQRRWSVASLDPAIVHVLASRGLALWPACIRHP